MDASVVCVWRAERGGSRPRRRAGRPSSGAAALAAATLLMWGGGCSPRPTFEPGDECELNVNCSAPLVCRLGRCRVECRSQRDCALGLACVRDALGLGACQLPEETDCQLASDCEDFLVCRFGRCTNACMGDVDCPPGDHCVADEDGAMGCRDESSRECELNSQCALFEVCALDSRCRPECRTARDCRDGQQCLTGLSPARCGLPDAGLEDDGGPFDAGPEPLDGGDGGALDGGALDGGALDGGALDGGAGRVPPPPPALLAAGADHTCGANGASDLRCWGSNAEGQLGDTTTDPRTAPVSVAVVAPITLLTVGARHSCAVADGDLYCWGSDSDGQIGDGASGGSQPTPSAVTMPGVSTPPTSISAGANHTCAIAEDALYCWGDNTFGQIGQVGASPRTMPTLVTGLPQTPLEVAAFSSHTCVRDVGRRVHCFGSNSQGQLGDDTVSMSATPLLVGGLDDVSHVAVGSTHSCALRGDGTVWCWGLDVVGQLGDGVFGGSRSAPMPTVAIGSLVLELALGSSHTCARTEDAQLFCWGDNADFQVGVAPGSRHAMPVRVDALSPTALGAGSQHACVRESPFAIRCFGSNRDGQLGTTGGGSTAVPQTVPWT